MMRKLFGSLQKAFSSKCCCSTFDLRTVINYFCLFYLFRSLIHPLASRVKVELSVCVLCNFVCAKTRTNKRITNDHAKICQKYLDTCSALDFGELRSSGVIRKVLLFDVTNTHEHTNIHTVTFKCHGKHTNSMHPKQSTKLNVIKAN